MEKLTSKAALITTTYFGNIQYYSKFFQYDTIFVEALENFQKQSFRNRCDIYAANGKLTLTVPVIYSNQPKTNIKDVRIDYATNWQKLHFKTIESAYRSAPFYEFIVDEFVFVFEEKHIFLYDLNHRIIKILLNLLTIKSEKLQETREYLNPRSRIPQISDYRMLIQPKSKKVDTDYTPFRYYQVFEQKHGFIENLSVIDLLFNEGNNAREILQNSVSCT